MPDGELIVEVDGSLTERRGDPLVQSKSSLEDLGAHVLDILLELLQVPLQMKDLMLSFHIYEGTLPSLGTPFTAHFTAITAHP